MNADESTATIERPSVVSQVASRLGSVRELGLLGIIVVFFLVMTFSHDKFLTEGNLFATGSGMAAILIVTLGMTIALISGGFDLSVGGVVAVTAVTMLKLADSMPMVLALLVTICVGLGFGLLNGFLIARVGINPLITTLGTLGMARGLAQVISQGTIVSPETALPGWFTAIGDSQILGVPSLVVWPLVLVVVIDFVVRRGQFFRKVYFIGGSEKAARFVGINVPRVQIGVYLISALLATIAGLLMASRFGAASADYGTTFELQAISAAVIGGATLSGGVGSIGGAFLAVVLLAMVSDALVLFSVSVFWQDFIYGAILIVAVAITLVSSRGSLLKAR